MKALVTGATGFIGGALALALLEAGWEVNVLVRPGSRHRLRALDMAALRADLASIRRQRVAYSVGQDGPVATHPMFETGRVIFRSGRSLFNPNQAAFKPDRYNVFEADLSQEAAGLGPSPTLKAAVQGCDVVFHAAAIRDRWGASPEEYYQTNVRGTRRLLEAAIGRAKRLVYVSSVGVLGYPGVRGIDESFPTLTEGLGQTGSPPSVSGKDAYHITKAEAEDVVLAYADKIEAVVVRPTITYGPGDEDGMLTRLISMLAAGQFVRIGSGQNHFHLTYIDDLVRGLLLAGSHPAAPGETFILAGPRSIAVGELLDLIETRLGRTPGQSLVSRFSVPEPLARRVAAGVEWLFRAGRRLRLPGFDGAPPISRDKIDTLCIHRGFSAQKAGRLLGFTPRVDYSAGLAKTMNWMAAGCKLRLPASPKGCSGNALKDS